MTLRCAIVLLAVGALAGCGGGQTSGGGPTTSPQGRNGRLQGTVTLGPTTPVCRQGTPCSAPASGTRLIFQRDGHTTASVVVAKDGSYTVSLPAGTYGVTASRMSIGRGLEPSMVRVVAGRTRNVSFLIDTGIR